MQREFARLVLELEEPSRTVVLLRYYTQLPPRTIARRLGVPVTTVHGRLQRGLRRLRDQLDRGHGKGLDWSLLLLSQEAPSGASTVTPVGLLLMNTKTVLSMALCAAGGLLAVVAWHQFVRLGAIRTGEDSGALALQVGPELALEEPDRPTSESFPSRSQVSIQSSDAPDPVGDSDGESTLPRHQVRDRMRAAAEATLRGDLDAGAFLDLGLSLVALDADPKAIPEASPAGVVRFPVKGAPD
ncbi:MAG TPA: sigma-70 region 4 domain-containing protein [Planctomycetota bacterium]|nr:sigma-70 region 4 domain-containing protein [Planctomycetota bacterium]